MYPFPFMYYMGCVKITSLATLLSMRLCLQVVLRHMGDIAASRALQCARGRVRGLRESWIRGCSDSRTIPSAGLQDYEDTRLKTSSRVRKDLFLAWKGS